MTTNQITGQVSGIILTSTTYQNPLTVTATGTITGTSYGIAASATYSYSTEWAIENYGLIGASAGDGISLVVAGGVVNAAGALISGATNGVYMGAVSATGTSTGGTSTGGTGGGATTGGSNPNPSGGATGKTTGGAVGGTEGSTTGSTTSGDLLTPAPWSSPTVLDNSGTITGTSGDGVFLDNAGLISNAAAGSIAGANNGVYLAVGGTVDNQGAITGNVGVVIKGGGTVTNAANASIAGTTYGVRLAGSGTATVENAGTISGGTDSVYLGAGANRLIVDAGAVFSGDVVANATATNTLELTSGASAGTISGIGGQCQGFQTVTIDSGATWTIAGTMAGFDGTTIGGFNTHDTLDLTNLTFSATDTFALSDTDLLSIYNSAGTTLDTVQLAGGFTGDFFHLASDGASGSDITVNENPACYCRGTLILTDKGKVPVEDLKIGDRLVTADGAAMPLKWIGRRTYAGWLAVGNPDVQPIRFKTGSLADNVPCRDLMVSPEHAMFLDGVLIPAGLLVNGVSITRAKPVEEVQYYHLELERHAVIFAEDAASETFVDDDSRGIFHNIYEFHALYPNEPRGKEVEYCAPRIEDGYDLEAARRTLMARAVRLQPNGTAAPVPVLHGYLDCVTRTTVEGWAFAPETPDRPVMLAILANNAVIGRVVANLYRADLAEQGIGNGCHAYCFTLPHGFALDITHEIEVRRETDWTPLTNSPAMLEPEQPILAGMAYTLDTATGVTTPQ